MGILRDIFAGPGTAKSAIDGVKAVADDAFFTQEEKAEFSVKVGEWFLKYLSATQPQNLARRVIAFMVAGLWVVLILLLVASWPFSEAYAKFVFTILTDVVAIPFAGIMAFYFATHLLRANKDDK